MSYLGFNTCSDTMTISLSPERVAHIRSELARFHRATSISVAEALSLIGTLVFASTVIRIGRAHYRALIDSVTALGPDAPHTARIPVTTPMQDSLSMWYALLVTINDRSAVAPATRPLVPGEIQTDASFTGWGWVGMGQRSQGPWPTDWQSRIGRVESNTAPATAAAHINAYLDLRTRTNLHGFRDTRWRATRALS